ncbi:hypothetical protein F981_01532 [Acinetobacter guillouiae CIP 63.46]|jgi:hypothetical protein|nr:hypothetical protein F981_01532 [Acinetobacter guillouiae CIP 63.46]
MLVVKISKPDREKILENDELIQTARELVKQAVPDYEQAYKLLTLLINKDLQRQLMPLQHGIYMAVIF